ncbi:MAG: M20/M25/M40 family metallo-hydrolase [Anaerolineales bacterium]|jgi:acetylornithine deacetylase/succinyl-diaminopimelate desuccinylase-like protein
MDLERLIQHTLAIQAVPAPTFQEHERAVLMQRIATAARLEDVEVDQAGNVLGRVPGTGEAPPVVVSAHLDSVFTREEVTPARRSGAQLVGPGVGDNAVALAALAELAEDLPGHKLPADVWLVANVCEEGLGNLLGMQHIVERFGDRVAGYVVLEGMALGHIYHRGLPIRRFRIEAFGEGGHSWIHSGRQSAIHQLIDVGQAILGLVIPETPRSTLNIGRIVGGTSINSIAAAAAMEIDMRSEEPDILEAWIKNTESILASRRTENMQFTMEAIGHRPGGGIPREHPLVRAAAMSYRQACSAEPALECGSTDASLPLSVGLPAVCVGVSYGGEAHTAQEFVAIDPIPDGYEALLHLVLEIGGNRIERG